MTENPPTRVLVVAINFAPELTGIGKYVGEMTAGLSGAGVDVRVVTAPPYYPAWKVMAPYSARRYVTERLAGATVYRCPLYVPRRAGGIARLLHLASFGLSSLPVIVGLALRWRPQLVFVVEPPLACAPGVLLAARLCGARTWLHVQDFEVDAAFSLGMLKATWVRRSALAIESWLMCRFDRVSSISRRMLDMLERKGVAKARIGFFPNWVDTDRIQPGPLHNALRMALGIADDIQVLLYSGNMGEKQGLDTLVEVAREFAQQPRVLFLMCGDGAARARIEAAAADLPGMRFLPLQPLERLNELLNLAQVHMLPQRADVEDLVLPSKLTAILASGRPVVASAAPGSELAKAAAAGGVVVAPGDSPAFAAALRSLLDDTTLQHRLGLAGRAYALHHWERRAVLQRLHDELACLLAQN